MEDLMENQVDLDRVLKEQDIERGKIGVQLDKHEILRRAIEIASSAYTRFNGDDTKEVQAILKKVVITASKKLDEYLANV